MFKKSWLIILLILIFTLSGCSSNNEAEKLSNDSIHLLITKNFGSEILLEKEFAYRKNITVMDMLLDSGLKIDTDYGGSFISGINGLVSKNTVSGIRNDWFYYVNGIFADVGPMDYFPLPGEKVWWDYHSWKMAMGGSTAVIGCYPEPFVHGYNGEQKTTYIMFYPEDQEKAQKLSETLKSKGVLSIELTKVDNKLLENRKGPTILLGEWEKIKDFEFLNKLNRNCDKLGTFVHFTDKGIEVKDYKGETVKCLEKNTGVIISLGEMAGDNSPLWIISGTDRTGYTKALDVLINDPEKLIGKFGLVISDNKLISLPYLEE